MSVTLYQHFILYMQPAVHIGAAEAEEIKNSEWKLVSLSMQKHT